MFRLCQISRAEFVEDGIKVLLMEWRIKVFFRLDVFRSQRFCQEIAGQADKFRNYKNRIVFIRGNIAG